MTKKFKKHKYAGLRSLFRLIRMFDFRECGSYDKNNIKKILLVTTTAIGDTVLSTPAIRAVRKSFPKGFVSILAHEKRKDLLAGNPYVDEIIVYRGKYKGVSGLINDIRKKRFDLAAVLHGNDPDIVPIIYLAGIPFRAGWAESRFSFLLTHTYARLQIIHLVHQRLNILKTLGIADDGDAMDLFLSSSDRQFVEKYLCDRGGLKKRLIGVHPFGSVQSKSWSGLYDFIDKGLSAFPESVFCVIGGKKEAGIIKNKMSGRANLNNRFLLTAGDLSLTQSVALIEKCSCFVTTDSGPMQMALALKVPAVVLAGPSDMRRTGPLDLKNNIVIQKDVKCRPCDLKECYNHICMDTITADDVVGAVKKIIRGV